MDYMIGEKSLTREQEQFIADGFKKFNDRVFHAENTVKHYTFLIEDPHYKPSYIASLQARLSFGNYHVFEVFVREEARKKGFATALIRHAISSARKARAMFISIKTCNPDAKKLYENLGFCLHDTMEGYAFDLVFWTLTLKL